MQKKYIDNLRISREKITWEGQDVPFRLGPEWLEAWQEREPGLDFDLQGPLTGVIHLEKHGNAILVRGRLAGALTLICGRCLATFPWPLAVDFDLLLEAGALRGGGEEVELSAADLDVDYVQGDEIDLEAIIKEQVLLALPLKPLCREDCAGLCPNCGVNRNEASCQCAEKDFSTSFAQLQKIREPS